MSRNRIYIAFLLLFSALTCLPTTASAKSDTSHPRLFMRGGQERRLVRNIRRDALWNQMHEAVVEECRLIDTLPAMERVLEGPRLHPVSCEVLRRVLFLSYAYRTTGERRFLLRAEKEMSAVCDFTDWNPVHFLDVAEMTTALAIGYDWLYNDLPDELRRRIVEAICQKGLIPSENEKYQYPFMVKESRYSNWGQVCHGGMAIGAIAVWDEAPELASRIVERSKEYIKLPMGRAYPPEGCYPEGFGYWAFGTQYNVLFLAAMESFFGEQAVAEYKATPGFIASGNFSQQLITPTLHTFGYSDNSTRIYLEPVSMWFYTQNPNPAMFYMQRRLLEKFNAAGHTYVKTIKNRLLPMMILWGAGTGRRPTVSLDKAACPTDLFYAGHGSNSVAVMRSGWDNKACYVGFKSGRPNNFHGHMDVGSFYYEADGVVWATDLGSDHYGNIAKGKINMFNMAQNSQRWTGLTRYNNFAHSTLTINGAYQKVDGQCYFESESDRRDDMWAESNLTPVYADEVARVVRRVGLRDGEMMEVADSITASEKPAEVVWNMTTKAKVEEISKDRIVLSGIDTLENTRKYLLLSITFDKPTDYKVECVPATPANRFEDANDNVSFLRIKYCVGADESSSMSVKMKTVKQGKYNKQ